jgi:LysM repeat protein
MDLRRRNPASLLAPIALVAFAFALVAVITGSNTPENDAQPNAGVRARDQQPSEPPTTTGDATTGTGDEATTTTPGGEPLPAFYTVKAGDTLAGIAETVGVPVERLQELNPELDPQALVSGQKIKLKE